MNPTVTNIQKYSIHDGEGIRTTIFFKGCPLRCIWCHNPETWEFKSQLLYNSEKCTKCLRCTTKCEYDVISIEDGSPNFDFGKCVACGKCAEACLDNALEVCGKQYSVSELFDAVKKDEQFYELSGGGVTLSGGEVMVQNIDFIIELLKKFYKFGIKVNIDTCGFVEYDRLEVITPYVDTFLYDIKHMDSDRHKAVTEKDNALILENIKKLSDAGAKIHVRLPLIDGINCDDENIDALAEFLNDINIYKISLLPFHTIGIAKFGRLGISCSDIPMKTPDKAALIRIKDRLQKNNFKVECESLV